MRTIFDRKYVINYSIWQFITIAKFVNNLFGEIVRMEIFYYYRSAISIKLKQRMMLFEKITIFEKIQPTLIILYFWHTYSLAATESQIPRVTYSRDTTDSTAINIILTREIFSSLGVSRIRHWPRYYWLLSCPRNLWSSQLN